MTSSLDTTLVNKSSIALDQFLEEEGIVATLRQRIANLEEFRDLYLELSSSSTSSLPISSPTSLEATIDEQTQTIFSLERQIQELNGCQMVLESEIFLHTHVKKREKGCRFRNKF